MTVSPADQVLWSLLSIRMDADRDGADLYCLLLESQEHDSPLMDGAGHILFFRERAQGRALLAAYGKHAHADSDEYEDRVYDCDVAQALYVLSTQSFDAAAAVLNAVNALLDLVAATGITLVDERRRALHALADYATTSKDIPSYLQGSPNTARELIDAILWCVGAIAVKGKIVSAGFGSGSTPVT